MVAIDKNVSTGFSLSENLEAALQFSTSSLVRVTVTNQVLDGEKFECTDSLKAESKLSEIRAHVSMDDGGIFLLFGLEDTTRPGSYEETSVKKCLMVSFIPEDMRVKEKMLFASSKGLLKKSVVDKNKNIVLEEYNCNELKEISEEAYHKKKNVEKPFTEQEKLRMEEDKAEKAGGYNIIARLKEAQASAPAYALPGFGIGMKPSEVKKDRIASMARAADADGKRLERVNFLAKMKEEKRKLAEEQKAAQEALKAASRDVTEKSDGENKEASAEQEVEESEVEEVEKVNQTEEDEESGEESE